MLKDFAFTKKREFLSTYHSHVRMTVENGSTANVSYDDEAVILFWIIVWMPLDFHVPVERYLQFGAITTIVKNAQRQSGDAG